jgi:hypothetical protein
MEWHLDLFPDLLLLWFFHVNFLHYLRLTIISDLDLIKLSIIWELLNMDLMDLLWRQLLDVNLLSVDLRLVGYILLQLLNLVENRLLVLMINLRLLLL